MRGETEMKSSDRRIITSHVGSLPRPPELLDPLAAKDQALPYDKGALDRAVARSVADVVHRQVALGIDVVGDGEHSKSSFAAYGRIRLGGLEATDLPVGYRGPTRDSLAFPAVYEELRAMNAARASVPGAHRPRARTANAICTGPISYVGQVELAADIDNLKAALRASTAEEAFLTALSPTNLELYYENHFYETEEEYLFALAEAMAVEYRAIVGAGFVLQIDDPRLATHYNRTPGLEMPECRKFIALRVEALNHALKGIPEDRVRFHTCYSVNIAPRVHDLELKHFLDLMLQIRAGAYSIEASNPRHEHEWELFADGRLPDGKLVMPGVVSHCIHLVEHPELVAQRLVRWAGAVGRERVIAGNDCGFATSAAGDELHPDVAWAKLEALVAGARLASDYLWGR
jgi:5-methyltetrahydropteroyltriglutamate--homocysteine methyltransferase